MDFKYLMTSEFNEVLSPREYKNLLFIFRTKYRNIENENTRIKRDLTEKEDVIKNLKKEKKENEEVLLKVKTNYNKTLGRKLSFKERFFGKINLENGLK